MKPRYIRTDIFDVNAEVSREKENWSKVKVENISASGLLFYTPDLYAKGDEVYFTIHIDPKIPDGSAINMNKHFYTAAKAVITDERTKKNNMRVFAVQYIEIHGKDVIELNGLIQRAVMADSFI